jgi:glutamine amidotransferase
MIGVLDFGVGNVKSILSAFDEVGADCMPISDAKDLVICDRLVLPGVGSFDNAMEALLESGLREPLDRAVLRYGIPVLGICVGMHMLCKSSQEGIRKGLGWIDAEVVRFDSGVGPLKKQVPHMGWNSVTYDPIKTCRLSQPDEYYFLHSYFVVPRETSDVQGTSIHGCEFCSVIATGSITGVQFHPEKSHGAGLYLLKTFSDLGKL